MRFGSILVITYGRSGSTLLQGVLNTLPSVVVRGENHDLCWGLYLAYKSMLIAKNKFGGENSAASTNPWYGAKDLNVDLFFSQARELLKAQICPQGQDPIVWGFKEIRYLNHLDELPSYLKFLSCLLPNPAIIFNTRNHDYVCTSGFFKRHSEKELRKDLQKSDRIFFEYAERHSNAFICRYERVVLGERALRPLFNFLGAHPNRKVLEGVLQTPHSYTQKSTTLREAAVHRNLVSEFNSADRNNDGLCRPEKPFEDYKPSGKVAIFCIVKDEIKRILWFLEYYRSLGCGDFIFIDTGSKDDTIEYLKSQPDVYLYHAPASQLSATRWGSKWINYLGLKHAAYRWALLADIDELISWPDQNVEGLQGLVVRAERLGLNRVFTPMIDIYSTEPCDTLDDYQPGEPYDALCTLMDHVKYTKAFWSQGRLILKSGPRMRYLEKEGKNAPYMTKQNLYYVEPDGFEHLGSHFDNYALPSPLVAPLLHFKFLPDFDERMNRFISEGFHWKNAQDYKNYSTAQLTARSFCFEGSVDFRSEEGLKNYIKELSKLIRSYGLCGSIHWRKFPRKEAGD